MIMRAAVKKTLYDLSSGRENLVDFNAEADLSDGKLKLGTVCRANMWKEK